MRIERTGKVAPLTPRLERFMREALGAKSLDDLQSPEQRRIDYACLNGLLAIELKTLEEDASERIDNLTDGWREREDFPAFLGEAPMDSIIKHMADPDAIRRKMTERIGRAIVSHLKKANKQLGAHAASFPRKNQVRSVLLVNEDHEVYDPDLVAFVIRRALARMEGGTPDYDCIDAVIFMTERHATRIGNRLAFPVLSVEGPAMADTPWKAAVLDRFMHAWAAWNNNPLYQEGADPKDFSTIEHVPDNMPRHEYWRLQYRRRPYMRGLTNDQLREKFDETTFRTLLAFIVDSPAKPPTAEITANMERFTHIMLEMGWRAIPVTQFSYVPERIMAAAVRLHAPQDVLNWLGVFFREAAGRKPAAMP